MVRAAGPEDCRKIYELICELEAEVLPYDRFSEIYRTQLADERYECLVWEGETGVLGVLNLRFEAQLHHGGWVAEILEFAVSGMCRGQGIGSALLRQGCRRAGQRGCMQIEAACHQRRTEAHRFYIREGLGQEHFKFSKTLNGER